MNNNTRHPQQHALTMEDYQKILHFYQLPVPRSRQALKKAAEGIIGLKLCRCLKKLEPLHGPRAIGECTSSVIQRKGYHRGAFRCTGRNATIRLYKTRTPRASSIRRRHPMQTRSRTRRNR